ncbi:disease resistance protein At4g27190-like [Pistacia vera]|uniref:disease resistance protein At4g27190-like n=1 Tax=Pistacia vera TaxID=55513 RepID=UPI001263E0A4|nr:disease resistance protein At4g27190-like [Pistacia vera]
MAEIATAVASEAAKKATETAKEFISQKISYALKYQSYIKKPKEQAERLRRRRDDVKEDVKLAERQGEEIYNEVNDWLTGVEDFMERVAKLAVDEDKAKRRCFRGLCPDLIKRYRLSKEAEKVAEDGAKLLGKGNFARVSHPVILQRTASVYIRGYEAFDSRMPVLQEIMEALKDPNVNMIGVYGMAGVGKTTTVKKVAWQAKEDKLFDEVVMTTVTQTPDFKKIQEEIADQLGLTFVEPSVSGRSLRLRDRFKREKRILVILDDIWAKIDLDAVGIPYGDIHEGIGQEKEVWKDRKDDERRYKILLTSRDQYVLRNHMNIQNNFLVGLLSSEEAWYLFRKIVGDSVETSDFRPVAIELVGKCACLPIAIETVAKALKSKSLPVWEDALGQLTRSNPRQIEGMAENVCSIIELSYHFLKSEEKSLFLLCGLFNGSRGILISDLLKYSMGLHLFRDVYTFEDGRNRLLTLIHNLKASSLLLDGITNFSVKMHDIIHAVVISIASSDEFMFNIKNVGDLKDVLEEKIPKTSTAITLPYGDFHDELPESLEYPKLKLFYLFSQNQSLQIPDLLFQGMKELQVLDLTGICLLPLPSSLRCLENLQTLCLDGCLLGDIAIVGELKKLKILSLVDSDIEKLPGEIGQLTRLKMLDLSKCSNLKVIPPNVISSLSRLEELYMGNSFLHWEIEGLINNQERKNASVLELKQLSCLTTLEIHLHDLQIIPQDLFSEKLKRYRILIGDVWDWRWYATYGETSRMLKIKLNNSISLIHRVKILLKRTEELHLELNGVKNAIDEFDEDGFAQLKHLHVQNGHELLYVMANTMRSLSAN